MKTWFKGGFRTLVANDVEHLFMSLFAISSVKYSFETFAHFLIGVFVFWLFDFCEFFIYSRYSPLLDITVCKYFLLVCSLSFHATYRVFEKNVNSAVGQVFYKHQLDCLGWLCWWVSILTDFLLTVMTIFARGVLKSTSLITDLSISPCDFCQFSFPLFCSLVVWPIHS